MVRQRQVTEMQTMLRRRKVRARLDRPVWAYRVSLGAVVKRVQHCLEPRVDQELLLLYIIVRHRGHVWVSSPPGLAPRGGEGLGMTLGAGEVVPEEAGELNNNND